MNGIFALEKPAGLSSANVLNRIQNLFNNSSVFSKELQSLKESALKEIKTSKNPQKSKRLLNKRVKIKVGHGGTLDNAASGVLVIGVGTGTKKLQKYLTQCVKKYETEAILGASTTSGDFEGEVLSINDVSHITKEDVLEVRQKFVGHIIQTPPIFSAIKMNGKSLYEYAREGIPLPKPIKSREVQIFDLQIDEDSILSKDHPYKLKKPELDENGNKVCSNLTFINEDNLHYSKEYMESQAGKEVVYPKPIPADEELEKKVLDECYVPPIIKFSTTVSSGTYIRSLISDIGKALNSAAYMQTLVRTAQAEWELEKNVFKVSDFENYHETVWGSVLETVLQGNSEINVSEELKKANEKFLEEHPEEKGKTYPFFYQERSKDHGNKRKAGDEQAATKKQKTNETNNDVSTLKAENNSEKQAENGSDK